MLIVKNNVRYKKIIASENLDNMMTILSEIREKHCETCKMGSCGHEIGYLSAGTSMDYAYDDLKVIYILMIYC